MNTKFKSEKFHDIAHVSKLQCKITLLVIFINIPPLRALSHKLHDVHVDVQEDTAP